VVRVHPAVPDISLTGLYFSVRLSRLDLVVHNKEPLRNHRKNIKGEPRRHSDFRLFRDRKSN
jgi:hypothetical protein